MKRVLALWSARNREYYRDKSALFWSLLFTPLLVIILAVSFSGRDQTVLTIGIVGSNESQAPEFVQQAYFEVINYSDLDRGLKQIQYQQIDLLLQPEQQKYWLNQQSSKSAVLSKLLEPELRQWHQQLTTGKQIRYIDWVLPGMLAMNIMFSGLFGVGYVIVRYRKNGVLKRLQASPVKAWQFLLAQGLSRLGIMLVVTSILFIGCKLAINLLVLGSLWLLLLIAALGCLSIISLALLFASRSASEEFTNGLLNAVGFMMLLLSEVWFSLDKAPAWLKTISELSPLTHFLRAARAVTLEGAGFWQIGNELFILTAISVVSISLAAKLFRWHPDN